MHLEHLQGLVSVGLERIREYTESGICILDAVFSLERIASEGIPARSGLQV
jgi:hypothetical protein